MLFFSYSSIRVEIIVFVESSIIIWLAGDVSSSFFNSSRSMVSISIKFVLLDARKLCKASLKHV